MPGWGRGGILLIVKYRVVSLLLLAPYRLKETSTRLAFGYYTWRYYKPLALIKASLLKNSPSSPQHATTNKLLDNLKSQSYYRVESSTMTPPNINSSISFYSWISLSVDSTIVIRASFYVYLDGPIQLYAAPPFISGKFWWSCCEKTSLCRYCNGCCR